MISLEALQQRIDLIDQQWPRRADVRKALVVACESAERLSRAVQTVRNAYGTGHNPEQLTLVPIYLTDKLNIRSQNSSQYMHAMHFNMHPHFDRTWASPTIAKRAAQLVHVFTDCDLSTHLGADRIIRSWLHHLIEFTSIPEDDMFTLLPDTKPPMPSPVHLSYGKARRDLL